MAKFCTKCGKSLVDSELCNCTNVTLEKHTINSADIPNQQDNTTHQTEQAQSVIERPVQQNFIPNQTIQNKASNEFLDYSKSMIKYGTDFLKKPSTMIRDIASREDSKAGLFFVVLQSIVVGIFALVLLNKIGDFIGNMFGGLLGGSFGRNPFGGSAFGGDIFGGEFSKSLQPSKSGIFFKLALATIAQFFLLCGVIFGLGKFVFKNNCSFKSLVGVIGASSLPVSVSILISIVMITIGFTEASIIILLGIMVSFILAFIGCRIILKIDEDKFIYLIPISYIIYNFIFYKIISEIIF